jgi:hypothetical protein
VVCPVGGQGRGGVGGVLGVWEGGGEEDLDVGGANADVVGDERGVVRRWGEGEGLGPGGVAREQAGLCLAEEFFGENVWGFLQKTSGWTGVGGKLDGPLVVSL